MGNTAGADSVLMEKHARGLAVVVSVEEFARLNGASNATRAPAKTTSIDSRGDAKRRACNAREDGAAGEF